MNRKEIADKLKHKRHNLKQIKEALKLVEDLDWKVSWALDFSEHRDINDALDPILSALSNAQDELEEQQEWIEQQLNEYKSKADMALSEVACDVLA